MTILNDLIIKQVKSVTKIQRDVRLPIQDYFSTEEIEKLIEDNTNTDFRQKINKSDFFQIKMTVIQVQPCKKSSSFPAWAQTNAPSPESEKWVAKK